LLHQATTEHATVFEVTPYYCSTTTTALLCYPSLQNNQIWQSPYNLPAVDKPKIINLRLSITFTNRQSPLARCSDDSGVLCWWFLEPRIWGWEHTFSGLYRLSL